MKASASISSLRHTAATTSCLPSVVWNDGSSSVLRHEAHASKVPTSTRTRQESQAAAQAAQTRWKGHASLLRPSSQRAPQAMVPDKAWLSDACNVHSIAAQRRQRTYPAPSPQARRRLQTAPPRSSTWTSAPATKASRQCGEGAVSSCLITTPKCMSVGVDAFHRPMWLNDNTDMKSRE